MTSFQSPRDHLDIIRHGLLQAAIGFDKAKLLLKAREPLCADPSPLQPQDTVFGLELARLGAEFSESYSRTPPLRRRCGNYTVIQAALRSAMRFNIRCEVIGVFVPGPRRCYRSQGRLLHRLLIRSLSLLASR